MSILRLTFEFKVPDGRLEQAKQLVSLESAVSAFRKGLPKHDYSDAVITPRGPKGTKAQASAAPKASADLSDAAQ